MSASGSARTFAREVGRMATSGDWPRASDEGWRLEAVTRALEATRLNRRELAELGEAFVQGLTLGAIGARGADTPGVEAYEAAEATAARRVDEDEDLP